MTVQSAFVARTAEGSKQSNTLRPVPLYVVKGRLFYKRKWDYDTATDTKKFKEYLPGAKIDLHVQLKGAPGVTKWLSGALTNKGAFRFVGVPECVALALVIHLEHKDNITIFKGREDLVDRPDFQVKTALPIWRRIDLDVSKLTSATSRVVDMGDVEIQPTADADADFAALCDAYKTLWRGHGFINEKTGHSLGRCPVNYPSRTTSYESGRQLYLLVGDLKDAAVLLHEYGHFIGEEMLGGLTHPGYNYNDDATNQHQLTSEEHYESAWNEGHATFLSCAIRDDSKYCDGYDTAPNILKFDIATDNITVGPHCEGSVQCALWDVLKAQGVDFKDGFWKAFKYAKRKADTIFAFYENWKDEGCPGVDKLKASLKKFKLDVGYKYVRKLAYGDHALDPAKPTRFKAVDELYDAYGKTAGGTLAKYKEEFYNRNRYVGGGPFAPGSKVSSFTLVKGKTYIVPERFQIT